ncbi:MAG: carbamoyltransferase HypF [Dissulfurispiraceae bacterium]|jgi:hydrogenase maturation protein HypF|nr:carbamoyltransferase HypF [Dissulfurispiraceae bacterium]
MTKRFRIKVKGVVQGVGFRPFVYNLARSLGITGFVSNTSEGVLIEAEAGNVDDLIRMIQKNAPELSRIDSVECLEIPVAGSRDFAIAESESGSSFTHISADISICRDCLKELLNPDDRRYRYPFINCTNCGPRYTITKKVPYDRQNTTMSSFNMCEPCSREYNDPSDRRFHAQPNACTVCGPSVTLVSEKYSSFSMCSDPLLDAAKLLEQGAILAVKGIGGFHLCCDAYNKNTVERLRSIKRKSNKPFALMAANIGEIKKHCIVSGTEETVLSNSRRPVVLLRKRPDYVLPDAVSPNNAYLGFMLPYTPLHYLLFNNKDVVLNALVMTSANNAEEPIVIDNDDAVQKLSDAADAFVFHNRDIFMRADDSVVIVRGPGQENSLSFIRRSRGYVPEAIKLLSDGPDLFAAGADLKNTFALASGESAVISQHIGDMQNYESILFYKEVFNNLKKIYNVNPVAVVCDLHPDYHSAALADEYAKETGIKKISIQHHHAHICSVMAEHGLEAPVIGIALDGTGYGTDGKTWGSEFMTCSPEEYTRYGHFSYIPLPGGDMAAKECWRCSLSLIFQSAHSKGLSGDDLSMFISDALEKCGLGSVVENDYIQKIVSIIDNPVFSPLSCGAGRVFDAVAGLIGTCYLNTFEGEAAISLEHIIAEGVSYAYKFQIKDEAPFVIDFALMTDMILNDISAGVPKGVISAMFHNTLAEAVLAGAKIVRDKTSISYVALSGGVFQNNYLALKCLNLLDTAGFMTYINNNVPCNDAGIALGQIYAARNILKYK